MTIFDLHGPWTGPAFHPSKPLSVRRRNSYRAIAVLCGVGVVCVGLVIAAWVGA